MATPNRWAIRDCGIASFYSLKDGKAIVTLETLKTSGVQTAGDTVYSQGGRGNARIVGFSSNRTSTLTLEDAIFDNQALAMLTGNELGKGSRVIDRNEIGEVTSTKLNLQKTPQGALVSVFKLNPDGTNGEEYTLGTPATNSKEYSVSAKQLTFHTSVANGTKFRVYYKVQTAVDTKTMKVTSDMFGGSFRVTLEVLVVDEFTKQAYAGILNIPNAKFMDNFDLSFSADGDPATLNLEMEVLKSPTSTDMWELIVFSEDDII